MYSVITASILIGSGCTNNQYMVRSIRRPKNTKWTACYDINRHSTYYVVRTIKHCRGKYVTFTMPCMSMNNALLSWNF